MVIEPFHTWPKTIKPTSNPKPGPTPEQLNRWTASYAAADAGTLGAPPAAAQQTAAAAARNGSVVGNGSSGADIVGYQEKLDAMGFAVGETDGVIGRKTEAAIRAFQAANGLTVDGIIGPKTRAAFAAADTNPPPPGPPAPVDGSDRKFYLQADNPAALKKFDQDFQTYNDFKTLQTPVDGSDRKFFAKADDPKAVEQFDRDLASYNRVKANVADAYQNQVDRLVDEQGLEPAVATHLVTQQLQAQGIPDHALPDGATTSHFDKPVLGSDRRLYAQASDGANGGEGDPTPLETFDADYRAYNQYKGIIDQAFNDQIDRLATEGGYSRPYAQHLVTQQFLDADMPSHLLPEGADVLNFNNPPEGSDRRLYSMAADGANDPTILENFDRYRDAYGDHKNVIAQSYDDRVATFMAENDYDQPVAEDLAALELKLSGMPAHLLPDQAKGSNFDTPLVGSDRRFNPAAFDRDLAQLDQLRGALDTTFAEPLQDRIDQIMKDEDVDPEVAKHLAGMEFGSALRANGIPQQALPAGLSITPTQVLIDKHDTFDKAYDDTSGLEGDGQGWSVGRVWDSAIDVKNDFLGLDDPDGKVGLADLDAVINNPDKFDSDVVAASMVLRKAADDPKNAELRSYFDQPSFWENLKNSPWADPNSHSLVVNLFRSPTSGFSPAFIERLREEGPDALRKIGNSLNQLDPATQIETLVTDPGQAFDNYASFLGGAKDFVVDTGKLVGGAVAFSNPVLAAALYKTTGTNVYAEVAGAVTGAGNALIFKPDQLAKDIVGWDQFVNDPFGWAGNQAPDIVLEILGTKGAGKAAKAARAADAAGDAAQAGRGVGRLDNLPPPNLDDALHLDSQLVPPRAEDAIHLDSQLVPPRPEDAIHLDSQLVPPRPEDAILLNNDPRVVNPRYVGDPGPGSGTSNRWENCVACAQAMDAHLAGSPASALPGLARTPEVLEDWIGSSFRKIESPQAIADELLQAGDGARGIVLGDRGPKRVGHAFNVVNDNGVIRFVDGQNGGLPATFDGQGYVEFQFLRTDNAGALDAADAVGDIQQTSGARFAGPGADNSIPSGGELTDDLSPGFRSGALQEHANRLDNGGVETSYRYGDDVEYDYAHVIYHRTDGTRSVIYEYPDGRLEAGPRITDNDATQHALPDTDEGIHQPSYELARLDDGSEIWARRNGVDPKKARDVAHRDVKGADSYSGAADDYRVDPNTGLIYEPEGYVTGDLKEHFDLK